MIPLYKSIVNTIISLPPDDDRHPKLCRLSSARKLSSAPGFHSRSLVKGPRDSFHNSPPPRASIRPWDAWMYCQEIRGTEYAGGHNQGAWDASSLMTIAIKLIGRSLFPLLQLIRNFKIEYAGPPEDIEIETRLINRPKQPVKLRLIPRKDIQ